MNLKETIFKSVILKTFFFAAVLCFFCGSATAQDETIIKSYTSNGSWEVPAGVSTVTIECIGGGGAGGYVHGNSARFRNSGGGGGGAYAKVVLNSSNVPGGPAGKTLTINVGAGGHALATDGNQVHGGDSYVSIGATVYVKAAGGKTVKGTNTTTGAAGGAVANCIGDVKYAGGKGADVYTALLIDYPGGGGGAAGSTGVGNAGNEGDGGAARAQYGGKGGNGKIIIGIGRSGEIYGGAGSGSKCTGIGGEYGGEGAPGYVVITYMAPPVLDVEDAAITVCSGTPFTVNPTGTIPVGTTYSWSAPTITPPGSITGATAGTGASNISGTLHNTTINDVDVVYNVTATSGSNTDNFTVTVTVKGIITPGSITNKVISCNAGDTLLKIESLVPATGVGQYGWERSTNGITWNTIEEATSEDYTPSYAGFVGKTYYRRLYVSGCATLYSNIDTVNYPGNVSPGEITSTQPQQYCKDSAVVAVLTANPSVQSGASYTTQWQISNDNGLTWANISGATGNTYNVNIPHLSDTVSYRYTITLPGCVPAPSNNKWVYSLYANPVINKLVPSDTCPGPATYIITPDITPSSGTYTYFWNGDATGAPQSTCTVTALSSNKCNQTYMYSLKVKDEHGCPSNRVIDSIAIPAETFTPIVEVNAKLKLTSSDCMYIVPNLKDTLESCFHSSCTHIIGSSYTQDLAVNTEIAPNSYVMVNTAFNTECDNHYTPAIKVIAPATIPTLTDADIDFDDSNDTIKLPYYGICDTLYYVHTPSYSTTSSSPFDASELTLTNNKSTDNEGTLLGRITGGEYTIIWRLTSPCGGYVEYTKKYIVTYPPCGGTMTVEDADHNVYQTVRVGCECWTKPNLKTITGVTGVSRIYQDKDANLEKYGRLYSWYSAVGLPENSTNTPDTTTDPVSHIKYIKGICPTGWGLPTTASFESMYIASGSDAANLKSSNISTWLAGMTGTDATGFSAVGAGFYMDKSPYFFDLLGETFFWTSEGTPVEKKGTCCSITHTCPKLLYFTTDAGMGYSIRCVKRSNN